ncbi:MAG: tuaG, partial [Cytophagaceae bacterium]|nr:tuaG [Cytophagaceae bacterium]
DDASTDDTIEFINKYTDPRIQVIKNSSNLERSISRNKGIDAAKGEFICFLDSDDYYLPNHLETLHREVMIRHHPVALIHTNVSVRNTEGLEIRQVQYAYDPIRNITESVLSNHIQTNTVCIHRTVFTLFKFDPALSVNEDVYLFAQIAGRFPVVHIAETTVVSVMHENNTIHLIKDHLTPQLRATRKIFADPGIVVSDIFKKNKYFELYSQLVYFHASNKKTILSIAYFLKGLGIAPLHKNNRTNLLNVIYHLPGGKWLKRTMKLFNN